MHVALKARSGQRITAWHDIPLEAVLVLCVVSLCSEVV
jgi:hypothetical protein